MDASVRGNRKTEVYSPMLEVCSSGHGKRCQSASVPLIIFLSLGSK